MTVAAGAERAPVFSHLNRMTDERGLFEHALHDEPRREHGYCVDDVARGLVVVTRQPNPDGALRHLAQVYLQFVLDAVADDGRCFNRMGVDGAWSDEPSLDDCWGRAIWGLGAAAASAITPGMRARALTGFRVLARQRSPHSRAMAFAALGAGRVAHARPDEQAALDLLTDCAARLSGPGTDHVWIWPEPRLHYANAAIAEALIVCGDRLDDHTVLERGLQLLDFLMSLEIRDGQLSVTPVGGRGSDDRESGFDQQPIEAASMADACATAYDVTADPRWLVGVSVAWRWFLGNNDSATMMFDPMTGAGFDGLERDGRNDNRGAESTLAMLATAQQAQSLRALR